MTRSFAPSTTLLLAFLSVACGYDNDGRERIDNRQPITVPGSIDTNATMDETSLTGGVGAFVEYASGGTWTLRVACDTATTGLECKWSIYAYTPVGSPIKSSEAFDLESNDLLTVKSDGELQLDAITGVDLDGVSFVTDPAIPVTFDLWLQDVAAPEQYFYYVSQGNVVKGAASSVIQLTPMAP